MPKTHVEPDALSQTKFYFSHAWVRVLWGQKLQADTSMQPKTQDTTGLSGRSGAGANRIARL